MLALIKSLNEMPMPITSDYIRNISEQFWISAARFKKISPQLTHIFYNNTGGYQLEPWKLDYRSIQLIISNLSVLIKDKSFLDYYQVNELLRSSNIQINKYIPRTYFFLKRYLIEKYNITTLICNENMEIKNGSSQGYFFLKLKS